MFFSFQDVLMFGMFILAFITLIITIVSFLTKRK